MVFHEGRAYDGIGTTADPAGVLGVGMTYSCPRMQQDWVVTTGLKIH